MALASLSKLTEFVSSILNSSEWKVVRDGITTATSATLESATAQFTTAMKGMTVTVTGAGTGGTTLLTTLATYISATQFTMADVAVVTTAAATVSFGGRSYDPRHTEPVIQEAILQKDLEVCVEILNSPDHPQRANFTPFAATTVVSGAILPAHTGVLSLIEVQFTIGTTWRFGIEAPFHKVILWSRNIGAQFATSDCREGFYSIERGQLFYTGTSARVTGVLLTKTTACQAPVEYTATIAVNAAAILFATEGDDIQATQALSQIGLAGFQGLGRGELKRVA